MATQATTAPRTDNPPAPSPRRKWWVIAIVGLVALGLGVGLGYALPERSGTDAAHGADVPAAVVDQVVAFLDDYETAWNNHDVDATLALYTDDFIWEGKSAEVSRARVIGDVAGFNERLEWEFVGEPLVIPAFNMANAYDVSAKWVEWENAPEGSDRITEPVLGISTYRLVDTDGGLKIYRANPSQDWFEE